MTILDEMASNTESTGSSELKCPVCLHTFPNFSKYRKHVINDHQNDFKCPGCTLTFSKISKLRKHLINDHEDETENDEKPEEDEKEETLNNTIPLLVTKKVRKATPLVNNRNKTRLDIDEMVPTNSSKKIKLDMIKDEQENDETTTKIEVKKTPSRVVDYLQPQETSATRKTRKAIAAAAKLMENIEQFQITPQETSSKKSRKPATKPTENEEEQIKFDLNETAVIQKQPESPQQELSKPANKVETDDQIKFDLNETNRVAEQDEPSKLETRTVAGIKKPEIVFNSPQESNAKKSRKTSKIETSQDLLVQRLAQMNDNEYKCFNIGEKHDEMSIYKRARRFTPNDDCLKSMGTHIPLVI